MESDILLAVFLIKITLRIPKMAAGNYLNKDLKLKNG